MRRSFKSQITVINSWINKVKQYIKVPLVQQYRECKYCNIFAIIKEGVRQHLPNTVNIEIFPQSIAWEQNMGIIGR